MREVRQNVVFERFGGFQLRHLIRTDDAMQMLQNLRQSAPRGIVGLEENGVVSEQAATDSGLGVHHLQ